ncbi:MAG: AbrB/MazE/SpoVT family DNA-binding domain-containing protein [Propionibacteriaceae bacterium]|jgi:AbrB family looped-hinge helix DNA binding protein|nr:AbrB/MazE/SpoVT family DNA-binding domain-containing protein [Propionibacteriaceae bacterium]
MLTATLTSKGQVTIPKDVRASLGLTQGDRIVFEPVTDGFFVRASDKPASRLAGFFGPWRAEPITIEQMERDIAEAAAR